MNLALRKPMTLDEFLAWEERQESRHEFDGFQPVAMTGGSYAHDTVVIFEVLSPSTEQTDLVAKNEEYEALPSVRRYIILRQDRIGGLVFERVGADWIGHLLRPGAVLHMPEIGIELPLADLYDRMVFPAPGEASTPDAAPSVPDSDGEPA